MIHTKNFSFGFHKYLSFCPIQLSMLFHPTGAYWGIQIDRKMLILFYGQYSYKLFIF